jgi:hypothetical protein
MGSCRRAAGCSRFAVELRHNGASEAENASTTATPKHNTATINKEIRRGVMAAELTGGKVPKMAFGGFGKFKFEAKLEVF